MKSYQVNAPIGRSKHSISTHDGTKFHADGSEFWDIEIFRTKKEKDARIKNLRKEGFSEFNLQKWLADRGATDHPQEITARVN